MSEKKPVSELTYIMNSVLTDEQVKDLIAKVASIIEENGGSVVHQEEWGSRRLAYPINKKRNGIYVHVVMETPGSSIARIERLMEINDNILRYMTLRLDAKMIRAYERRKTDGAAAPATA